MYAGRPLMLSSPISLGVKRSPYCSICRRIRFASFSTSVSEELPLPRNLIWFFFISRCSFSICSGVGSLPSCINSTGIRWSVNDWNFLVCRRVKSPFPSKSSMTTSRSNSKITPLADCSPRFFSASLSCLVICSAVSGGCFCPFKADNKPTDLPPAVKQPLPITSMASNSVVSIKCIERSLCTIKHMMIKNRLPSCFRLP